MQAHPLFWFLAVALPAAAALAEAQQLQRIGPVPSQPYVRWTTTDALERTITFYLSEQEGPEARPLAVFVQGSGCGSLFVPRGDRFAPVSGHATVRDAGAASVRTLIVEKPGVDPLTPSTGDCTTNLRFNEEHRLDRWTTAILAAIQAARGLPGVSRQRLLVVGHSEGGVVAARVARNAAASHVALLAGEGPSQLFSLLQLARDGKQLARAGGTALEREAYLVGEWRKILAEPERADRFFYGFAYRRWSSFLRTSPLDELAGAEAKVFIAQGTEDAAVAPASADVLYAQLLTRGHDVTLLRVEGADHSFVLKSAPATNGWDQVLRRMFDWFDGGA